MSRRLLVRVAAVLAFITCLGHTVGTFMKVPPEQTAMHATIATMKSTLVPMPVGPARSYMQILDGNNICTSLFLALCGGLLWVVAGAPAGCVSNRVIALAGVALGGFAMVSGMYFFPVPTVFTGLGAVLCFVAVARGDGGQGL